MSDSKKSKVTLRPVCDRDSNTIYTWQQDPRVRRYFHNPAAPEPGEHATWFNWRKNLPSGYFFIIEFENMPSGVVRLDEIGFGQMEISIFVDPSMTRRGIASATLKQVRQLSPFAELRANILPGNNASQLLFTQNDYVYDDATLSYLSRPEVDGLPVALCPDGGANVGLGHAMRCCALADAMDKLGFTARVFIDPDAGLGDYLHKRGWCPQFSRHSEEDLLNAVSGAKVVVFDSYRIDIVRLANSLRPNTYVVCFDDFGEKKVPVDVVINGSPSADRMDYSHKGAGKWLTGGKYQVISTKLKEAQISKSHSKTLSLVVSLGGADLAGIVNQLFAFVSDYSQSSDITLELDFIFWAIYDLIASICARKCSCSL